MRVLVLFGTRPEVIKMAPLVEELKKNALDVLTCSTGQQREMVRQACEMLNVKVDFELDALGFGHELYSIAGAVLGQVGALIAKEKPDWVLVQGDTTTASLGGLAAFYNKVKVGHVEAGLRSFDNQNPFPEEVNRKLIAAFATLHFVPTDMSRQYLLSEGVKEANIKVTGNTVIDAVLATKQMIEKNPPAIGLRLDPSKKLILVTSHRRENYGQNLLDICDGVLELARTHQDIEFIFPVHLNPNVSGIVHSKLDKAPHIHLTPPLNYLEICSLIANSYIILTDSGGLQEEATAFNKPVLILRKKTERMEGVNAGVAKIIGTSRENIVKEVRRLLENKEEYLAMSANKMIYGDGTASKKIIDCLMKYE